MLPPRSQGASGHVWDPIQAIGRISIPVLTFLGEKDTQIDPVQGAEAYRDALIRDGNPHSRVEVMPGTDHNVILSETGCTPNAAVSRAGGWRNYPPAYLDLIEEWLTAVRRVR